MNDTAGEQRTKRRLQEWLDGTGYTQATAARALGVDLATMRDWRAGTAEPPQMAFLSLELLAQRANRDGAVIATACRIAAAQALAQADRMGDFQAVNGLRGAAERYMQIATRYEPQCRGARGGAADTD